MRVRCLTNDVSALPASSIVARQRQRYFGNCEQNVHLTPRKSYVVYALVKTQHGSWIYIADDDYPSIWYPVAYPLDFFEVVDERVSVLWESGVSVAFADGEGYLESFEEWVKDPCFYDRLFDKGMTEITIFNKQKEFMDLEYPFPADFRSLKHFDTQWCQCPACEHIWEDGAHGMGMKRCPACGEVLVDGLWKGVHMT